MTEPSELPPQPPTPLDWAQVRALFDRLDEAPAAEREPALLASGAAPAVIAEVRSLLAQATEGTRSGGFLADSAASLLTDPSAHTPLANPSRRDQRLGPWQLGEVLGSGGMGEVYRARRVDGAYDGEAAVKILKRGMDSASVLARFAQEQRALARLNHPHIARLFDAGLTTDGLPYFVMELVEGRAIDQAVSGRSLDQRLALFLQLTDAVSHAHRQLLVHRDLKPSNVLVDGQGQVKLLDFGIAKAIDPVDGVGLDATAAGHRPYTPNYASPEQVRGEPVGTGTDIYSLGVLLYLMITGARPYGREATTPAAAARSVLEEQPTRPSALSPGLVADPQWLATRKRLEGDLDNILLKALEKPAERRYASVDALAADVRAHLSGFPVSARPASAWYLAGKFVRRHRATSLASVVALLAIVVGSGLALWQAHLAQAQQALAERRFNDVRQFARTMLFDVDQALRDGPTAGREKLVSTALAYLDRLSAERLTDADLLRDVAEGYERIGEIQGGAMHANLGRPDDAKKSLLQAMAIRQQLALAAPDDEKNLRGLFSAHERLGDNERAKGQLSVARDHYTQAVQFIRRLASAQPDDLKLRLRRMEAERYLASVQYWPFNASLGDYAGARPQVEALAGEMDGLLAAHPGRAEVLEAAGGLFNQLSDFQRVAGEYAASLATQRHSHAVAEQLLAIDAQNPRWQRWLYLAEGRLADALIETGEVEPGLAMWRRSIAHREAVASADASSERAQRNVANGYGPLAEQLAALGRHGQAVVWYSKENELLRSMRTRHPQVQALAARLDESDRDLALLWALTGRGREGLELSRALQLRRQTRTGIDATLQAKYATTHARIVLASAASATSAEERAEVANQAVRSAQVMFDAAQAEPFNAFLAREAAMADGWVGSALAEGRDARACRLIQRANQSLTQLRKAGRLPPSHDMQARGAAAMPAGCAG